MKKLTGLMIVVAVVMSIVAAFASAAEKYDVAAFYWPSLHFDERWAEFFPDGSQGEWESIRNCKPKWQGHWQPRVPAWGYLMDNDPKAMEKKINAATSHGVNVMIFDWYWFENKPFLESALNDGFLKAKNVDKMKFYLMWANHDAKTTWDIRRSHKRETIWPGSVDLPTFKTVVARVIKKYFSHPSYYKIDGKPVFSIYDMNNLIKGLGGVKQAAEALDYFRNEVKNAGFPGLHFQMIYWGRVPKIDDSGFASAKGTAANTIKTFKVDSLTNYQFVHLARPEADYIKWADKALSNWPKWSKNFDVPYFPHVSIGWDNNARFVRKMGAVTDNVNPQTFKKYLLKAKAYADAHPNQTKLITINAWNEWVEGSYLEPDERFGMGYLQAVKDVFVSPENDQDTKADIAAQKYSDGRPSATLRMDAKDQGIILKHGDGPNECDILGAREALIFKEKDVYHLFYDGAGPNGWRACLATSKDLINWKKKGPVLDFGKTGEMDSAAACAPWVYKDRNEWHMFYLGTPNTTKPPGLIPSFPYLTMKAKASSLSGPWVKQKDVVPFRTKPNTYYSMTASPGHVVKNGDQFLQFFSSTTRKPGNRCVQRTLGIARTKDLDGTWTIDPKPMVPIEEQIENSSLYYEKTNKTWFLFTNHIGIDGGEYTDAVWVYWTRNLNKWNPKNKAVVLDGKNCKWSTKCIGMPSVIQVGARLAIFYDAPGQNSTSHLNRNIGMAWLDLPLTLPKR